MSSSIFGLVHFYKVLFASGFLGFEDDLGSFVQRSMKISQRRPLDY